MPPHPAPQHRGSTLDPLQEAILDFERIGWRRTGDKDNAIRQRFGISPAAYYVELSRLIESDEAMAYDPLLVQRLLRRVEQRSAWHAEAGM